MHFKLGNSGEILLSATTLYDTIREGIKLNIIKHARESNTEITDSRTYIIGDSVKFRFRLSSAYICSASVNVSIIDENNQDIPIFNTSSGWLYRRDEIASRDKIVSFLTDVYNKVKKVHEIERQRKLSNERDIRKDTIKKINNIKIKELC